MKITITEYNEQQKVISKVEYCTLQGEVHYSNLIPLKGESNEQEEARTKKQTSRQIRV